jgi:hypothetical protein
MPTRSHDHYCPNKSESAGFGHDVFLISFIAQIFLTPIPFHPHFYSSKSCFKVTFRVLTSLEFHTTGLQERTLTMEQGVNQFVTSPLAKHDCIPLGAGAHLLEIFLLLTSTILSCGAPRGMLLQ